MFGVSTTQVYRQALTTRYSVCVCEERERERETWGTEGSYHTNPRAIVNKIVEISSCVKRDLFETLGST